MTRLVFEAECVVYAMLIAARENDADWTTINMRIAREHGENALRRIKRRAWAMLAHGVKT